MRRCLLVFIGLLGIMQVSAEETAEATEVAPITVRADPDDPVDEIVVEEQRMEDFTPLNMGRIRDDGGLGAKLYRQRRYAEAFPLLLNAAQEGFKLAQARVSYIYQLGLGGVPRDAEAAIGWLGVAASPTTNTEIKTYYSNFLSHIPEERMAAVNGIVADYTAKWGSDAVGLFCSNTRMAGTHISRLKCDFEEEYDFRDGLDDDVIAAGIGPIVDPGN